MSDIPEAKREKHESNHSIILEKLSDLTHSIAKFGDEAVNSNINLKLKNLAENIPKIVVWGAQSSGKSTLLNLIFPKLNLKSCEGVGTRCPIEIRASVLCKSEVIQVWLNNQYETFESMEKAQAEIDKYAVSKGATLLKDVRIIREIPSEQNAIYIDMPGCVNGEDQYFGILRNYYLAGPETIVIHVTKCDMDPSTDISAPFLKGLNSKVVLVATHGDVLLTDPGKIANVKAAALGPNVARIAITAKQNEAQIWLKVELPQLAGPPIRGHAELRNYIAGALETKVRAKLPYIRAAVGELRGAINARFSVIGNKTPDMRDARNRYRRAMCEKVNREFGQNGSKLSVLVNVVKEMIRPDALEGYSVQTPSVDDLAQRLKTGTRRQIKGAEGWSDIVIEQIRAIMDSAQNGAINSWVSQYFGAIQDAIDHVFEAPTEICAFAAQNKHQTICTSLIRDYTIRALSDIQILIDAIKESPHMSDMYYNTEFMLKSNEEAIKLTAEYFLTNKGQGTLEGARKYVANKLKNKDQYMLNAEHARAQIITIWANKCSQIADHINESLGKREKELEAAMLTVIDEAELEDMAEPENIAHERELLHGLEVICESIILETK